MFEEMEKLTTAVINKAMVYAKEESAKIISETQKKINESITPKILEIKVNEYSVQQLTTVPVPYLDRLVTNAKVGLNTLLVGPAGCGKTIAAAQLAQCLNIPFGHLCFTSGASETWLFGRQTPNGFIEGVFAKLYKNGGVFLADEMDAADPNLLLSINTALSSDHFLNPISGEELKKHKDFVFVGACNTFGKGGDHIYTGRNRLDAATLDRFVSIRVDYDRNIESAVCPDEHIRETLRKCRDKLIKNQFEEVVSTRLMANAYVQFMHGIYLKDIFDSIMMSWSKDAQKILKECVEDVIPNRFKI